MKNLNRNDFTKEVNSNGYQILYKGVKIGGAGTMPSNYMKTRRSAKSRSADIKMYSETAERDIEGLVKGIGRADMLETIKIINETKTK